MAIVAGLFDSEVDATKAFDRLLRENLPNLETQVIDGSARGQARTEGTDVTIPIIPITSGGPSQTGIGPAVSGSVPVFSGWLDDMDDVERKFYEDAVKEGSTLALARVSDDEMSKVRLIFQTFGARIYDKK